MELENYLDQMDIVEYLEDGEEVYQPFKVDTEDKAVWAMRKLSRIRNRMISREETAKKHIDRLLKEIERAKEWAVKENEADAKSAEFFEGLLIQYGMNNLDGKKKSINLPNGTLKLRKTVAKLQYNDELLLEKLRGTDFCKVKTVESIDKTALKKALEIAGYTAMLNGEQIEGISIIEAAGEKWSIDIDKEEE